MIQLKENENLKSTLQTVIDENNENQNTILNQANQAKKELLLMKKEQIKLSNELTNTKEQLTTESSLLKEKNNELKRIIVNQSSVINQFMN